MDFNSIPFLNKIYYNILIAYMISLYEINNLKFLNLFVLLYYACCEVTDSGLCRFTTNNQNLKTAIIYSQDNKKR